MSEDVSVRRGFSFARDPRVAADELHRAIVQPDMGLVGFFCSTQYELDVLGPELHARFGSTNVIGCTTAGEITPIGYMDGSITGFSIAGDVCRSASACIAGISEYKMTQGQAITGDLMASLRPPADGLDPSNTFALLLIDGMTRHEEAVVSSIHGRLDNLPLLGGSAGDDLRLQATYVYHEGRFHRDAALLTLVNIDLPFRVFRSHNLKGTDRRMVVTRADPENRVVMEINAEPAAVEYARLVGVHREDLTPMIFAEYPVMVKVGGDYYVRSIQKVGADGSLTFFCAIDEGVVLTLAEQEDMVSSMHNLFRKLRDEIGPPQLVIGFDCVLRGLEAEKRQLRQVANQILADNKVIGFSSYGEQFSAMHVNQTFTGVAIGRGHDEC